MAPCPQRQCRVTPRQRPAQGLAQPSHARLATSSAAGPLGSLSRTSAARLARGCMARRHRQGRMLRPCRPAGPLCPAQYPAPACRTRACRRTTLRLAHGRAKLALAALGRMAGRDSSSDPRSRAGDAPSSSSTADSRRWAPCSCARRTRSPASSATTCGSRTPPRRSPWRFPRSCSTSPYCLARCVWRRSASCPRWSPPSAWTARTCERSVTASCASRRP
mmetsp:Transcript_14002/g.44856  ORF Transcript_14002/g.44856 Transcript_14002/m.44856 type:complete len:220 (-) Transcript_14002:53-712(-)